MYNYTGTVCTVATIPTYVYFYRLRWAVGANPQLQDVVDQFRYRNEWHLIFRFLTLANPVLQNMSRQKGFILLAYLVYKIRISKIWIFVGILKAIAKKSRIRSRIRNPEYGSKDPNPYQNVTDPEDEWYDKHWKHLVSSSEHSGQME